MTSANKLTVLRIILVPILVLLVLRGNFGGAVLIFFLAGATDLLDGLIARRFGQRTPLGIFLDPAADKLLLTCSFVVLSLPGLGLAVAIPLWLTATVIGRDLLLVVGVALVSLMFGPRPFPPSIYGKATTAAQLLTVLSVLVANYLQMQSRVLMPLFYTTLGLTVFSGLHYLGRGVRNFFFETGREASRG